MLKIFLVLLINVFFIVQPGYAHPPSKIDAAYSPETKILSVVVTHPVNDRRKHFIKRVDVSLNGEQIEKKEFKTQTDNATQMVSFTIAGARSDDVITVEAQCNISGKLTETIEVGR